MRVGLWIKTDGMFPSPRGVELHKPGKKRVYYVIGTERFPSPRGVELHKPDGKADEYAVSNI